MHDCLAFHFALHSLDRIKRIELLISFGLKLPCLRRLLSCTLRTASNTCLDLLRLTPITSKLCPELTPPGEIKL